MKFIHAHNYSDANIRNMDFYVNSCGYYSKLEKAANTNRPTGREDYQLICVTEGKLYTERDGEVQCHLPGDIIIYYPGESQRYYSYVRDCLSYYWIHFDGKKVKELFKALNLWGKKNLYAPANKEDIKIIYRMTEEINRHLPGNGVMLESLFCQLCVDITRRSSENSKSIDGYSQLGNAIRSMEHNPGAQYDIDDYAHMCSMSRYHFMHVFKNVTGKTPIQYRNELRITRGATLLLQTDMNIKSISEYIGFEDPLYFSRCFRKYYGISPSDYRSKGNAE